MAILRKSKEIQVGDKVEFTSAVNLMPRTEKGKRLIQPGMQGTILEVIPIALADRVDSMNLPLEQQGQVMATMEGNAGKLLSKLVSAGGNTREYRIAIGDEEVEHVPPFVMKRATMKVVDG